MNYADNDTSERILTLLERVEAACDVEAAADSLRQVELIMKGDDTLNVFAFYRERDALLQEMREFRENMAERLNEIQSISGSPYGDMFPTQQD